MRHVFLVLLFLIVMGCARVKTRSRYASFPYAKELVTKVQKQNSRGPASFSVEEIEGKSSRRVYFSALYYQYRSFSELLGQEVTLSFCPQFHHDRIQIEDALVPKVTLGYSLDVDVRGRDFFPELIFKDGSSFNSYHQAIQDELQELCEYGISDNFYKFDNLITHYSKKRSFHQDPKAMESVLKIPVFANFYLLKMMEVSYLSLTSPHEEEFIRMTNTFWLKDYIQEATKMRPLFINNKTVRR